MRTVGGQDAQNKSMTVKTVLEGKTPGGASDEPVGRTDLRQLSWSEAQGSRTEQYWNNDLLQITLLCATAKPGQADARSAKPW